MSDETKTAKGPVGCAMIFASFPASVIWWVLFGFILHKTQASVMEWSLYVGYLVLSVFAFALGALFRMISEDR